MPISPFQDETIRFRSIQLLAGQPAPIQVIRRNGRVVPLIPPEAFEPPDSDHRTSEDFTPLVREIMYGLNRIERRTWLLLLLGNSIFDVALQEGVSRPAIYARIRGDSKHRPG